MKSWKEGAKTEVVVFSWNRIVSCTEHNTPSYPSRGYPHVPYFDQVRLIPQAESSDEHHSLWDLNNWIVKRSSTTLSAFS